MTGLLLMLGLLGLLGCAGDASSDTATAPVEEIPWVGAIAPFCTMEELGRVDLPGEFGTDVAVIGEHAYVAWGGNDGNQGLEVVDFSDPNAPTVVGHAETGDYWPIRVSAGDNMVFVAHQWDGVYIFDVGNATAPVLLSNPRVDLNPDNGYGVRVTDTAWDGRYLFVTGTDLVIYDLQDPTNPVQVGRVPPSWDETAPVEARFVTLTETVWLRGNYAYITDLDGRLFVVDITDVTAPAIVSSVDWVGGASSMTSNDTTGFIADLVFGVRTVDLSDPLAPRKLDTMATSGETYATYLDGNRLYLGDNLNGVMSFDVSDPMAMTWMSYHAVDEGAGAGGVGILEGDGPWGVWAKDGLVVAVTKPDLRVLRDCNL